MSPVRNAMIKKVDMELATLTIGRYSTPYLFKKAVSAKLLKRMLEVRMKKRMTKTQKKREISSS